MGVSSSTNCCCASDSTYNHSGALRANLGETCMMLLFFSLSAAIALPTFNLSSGITANPMGLATDCPDGNSTLQPRSKLRSGSEDGLEATEAGSEPRGFTTDESGL